MNYAKIRETAVFCALCDFPMVVRVVQKPCCHIICYTCYCQSPKACKMYLSLKALLNFLFRCDERIETIIRLPDKLKISLVKDEDGFPVYRDE